MTRRQMKDGQTAGKERGALFRVLLLSGSARDVEEIETMLRKADLSPAIRHVTDTESLWQQISDFSPGLVLLDNATPGADCKTVLVEAGELTAAMPFICVADAFTEEEAIDLLNSGARDFVVKYRPGRLAVAVSRMKREIEEREELRRTTEALRKSEDLLAQSQRIAKIGSWSWDLETGEFIWSDEMYHIFGLDKEVFRPSFKGLMHYIHRGDRKLLEKEVEGLRKGRGSFKIEHRILRPDGSVRYISAEGGTHIIGGAGQSGRIIGMVLDITERHEADERTARLTTAIEQAGDAVAIADRQGKITYSNSAFCDLAGLSEAGAIGKGTELLKNTRHNEAFFRAIWNTLRVGNVWSGRIVATGKDGGRTDIEATVTPVKDVSGEIVNFVVVCRNITDQLKLEQQLRQTQKSEALGTLASGIAQDFNNILATMIGFTEMALGKEEMGGEASRRSMERVLKAGMRGRELVKQVLMFSRRQVQEYRLISVRPVVLEILRYISSSFPPNIEITHQISAGSFMTLGDPSEIQQAIVNLCTNAMQAMADKGGALNIALQGCYADAEFASRAELKEGPYVRLSVTDTGKGMEPSAIEHAFDPFFSSRSPGRTTGLGLPVALSIVKGHGGTITIDSESGKGSSLHVFLPVVEGEPETEGELQEIGRSGDERILYVDDEEVIVDMARHTLELLGYRVVAVTDPSLALELFLKQPNDFDIVITDQMMPGMTGTELSKVFLSLRPDIPIILTTGFSETINAATAKSIGIRAFVMKPLTRGELAETIRRVLDKVGFLDQSPSL